ncbi:alpha/beta hydrolase [Streptosporangium sp. NPDC051022]|uniref:alpha/beta hydrolase n=1 Tax=Streptosporangium sp. NPDC051022 TaxID=3155752 RepID=UPI003442BB21
MRRSAALLLGLVTPLALLTPVSAATAQAAGPRPAISWAPCPEDPATECGTLAVPIDWKRPSAGTFNVGVARHKATDPAARIGTLALGAGGPGESGVEAVLASPEIFSPEILRRFDIVGLDPRGTNRSHPVVCSTDLMAQAPDPLLKSQADFDRRLAYNERLRADCRARTGPLFDHVDSLSTAADLDAFRAALGEEKLSFWGGSYGTLLGQQYAERYPRRVRAFVLDSTMDHSLDTQSFMDTETWGAQDAFNEFVAWCDRDSRCLQHGQDVKALWKGLLTRADRGELPSPEQPDIKMTAFMLIDSAVGYFYTPASWLPFSELLAAFDSGGATPQGVLPLGSPMTDRTEEVTPNPVQITCEDFRLPVRDYREYSAHLRRMAKIAPDMRYNTLSFLPVISCLGQPDPIPNPQRHLRVRTDTPVLVVNSKHDPATVYPWAQSTARQLGRSGRLLTYEGWGHIAYRRGTCVTETVDSYLISQTLPARGASCPAVPSTDEANRVQELIAPRLPRTPGWTFPF